ncbi:hypothetical protein [Tolypothrix sp. NIES-4075]|nr:hypothetical protein [Tolypothrix sp. NIES-4075]
MRRATTQPTKIMAIAFTRQQTTVYLGMVSGAIHPQKAEQFV